jgi:spore photoproduct lyase
VPPNRERIAAAAKLADRGWLIGLRFDPLLAAPGYETLYEELFGSVFSAIPSDAIHSVGYGAFRLPRDYFHRVARLYPEEKLFASALEDRDGMVSYLSTMEDELLAYCRKQLLERISEERLFAY